MNEMDDAEVDAFVARLSAAKSVEEAVAIVEAVPIEPVAIEPSGGFSPLNVFMPSQWRTAISEFILTVPAKAPQITGNQVVDEAFYRHECRRALASLELTLQGAQQRFDRHAANRGYIVGDTHRTMSEFTAKDRDYHGSAGFYGGVAVAGLAFWVGDAGFLTALGIGIGAGVVIALAVYFAMSFSASAEGAQLDASTKQHESTNSRHNFAAFKQDVLERLEVLRNGAGESRDALSSLLAEIRGGAVKG